MNVVVGEKITIGKRIGKGVYGFVYLSKEDPNIVYKITDIHDRLDDHTGQKGPSTVVERCYDCAFDIGHVAEYSDNVLREASLYHSINNSPGMVNIIKMQIFQTNLVYEMEHGGIDLHEYIKIVKGPIPLSLIKNVLTSVSSCMIHANNRFVMNCDIKPQNIMIDMKTQSVRLTDWSLGRLFVSPSSTLIKRVVQTMWYRAPEQIFKRDNNHKNMDVWSLGVIFLELLTGGVGIMSGMTEYEMAKMFLRLFGAKRMSIYSDKYIRKLRDYREEDYPGTYNELLEKLKDVDEYRDNFGDIKDLLDWMLDPSPKYRADFVSVYNHELLNNTPIKRESILERLDYRMVCVNPEHKCADKREAYDKRTALTLLTLLAKRHAKDDLTVVSYAMRNADNIVCMPDMKHVEISIILMCSFIFAAILHNIELPIPCRMFERWSKKVNGDFNNVKRCVEIYNILCIRLNFNINGHTGINYVNLLSQGSDTNIMTTRLFQEVYLDIQVNTISMSITDRSMAKIAMYVLAKCGDIDITPIIKRFISDITPHERLLSRKFCLSSVD